MDNKNNIHIPPELENLLLEFTINVIVENPTDLVSHAADYFIRLKEEQQRQYGYKRGESDEEIAKILGMRGKRHRQSVVGEQYNPEEDDDDEDVEVYAKTDEQRNRIRERAQDVFLFRALDENDFNSVIDAMMPKKVKKGQTIIREGDDGDYFYVIDEGTFEAYIKDKDKGEQLVKSYDDGGSFGELALLHNQPRAATIKATSDGLLWAVSRKSFTRLVVKRAFQKRQRYMKLLEAVPALKPLNDYEKMQIADALKPMSFKKGQVIFKEGEEGDGMYFIEEGRVRVIAGAKDKEKELAKLNKGQFFGEMALVKNQPRAGSIVAMEDTKVAFLEVKAFERLLGPCMDIMKRHIETYDS